MENEIKPLPMTAYVVLVVFLILAGYIVNKDYGGFVGLVVGFAVVIWLKRYEKKREQPEY